MVFWVVTFVYYCRWRSVFGGTYHLHPHGRLLLGDITQNIKIHNFTAVKPMNLIPVMLQQRAFCGGLGSCLGQSIKICGGQRATGTGFL
jgi:hypothetical protein